MDNSHANPQPHNQQQVAHTKHPAQATAKRMSHVRQRHAAPPSSQTAAAQAAQSSQPARHHTAQPHAAHHRSARHVNPHQAQLLTDSAYSRETTSAYAMPVSQKNVTRRNFFKAAAGIVVVAGIGATGVYLVRNPPMYDVQINGATYRVKSHTRLQDVIDDGLASPKPGNLIAVDGSVATEGGGDAFAATINGKATNDPAAQLRANAEVTIADGANVTEDFDETTETIPYETKSDDHSSLESYFTAALHVYNKGSEGEKSTRTGKVSGKTVSTITKEPVNAGYHLINANVGDEKVLALTFDDGPWDTTPELLDVLKENEVHATFFVIGNQVADNADTVKRAHAEGHQIATHTWDHAAGVGEGVNLTYMSDEAQKEEISKGIKAIEDCLGGEVTHILRAPGGNFYGKIVETLEGMIDAEIGWNLDTMDWSRPGAAQIESTLKSAQAGNVILCHDGGGDRTQTIEAVKNALPYLKEQGFSFVTIDELLALNNKYASQNEAPQDKAQDATQQDKAPDATQQDQPQA